MGGAEKCSCCRNGMSVVYDLNLDDIKWQAGGQTDRRLHRVPCWIMQRSVIIDKASFPALGWKRSL